ncbi:MAG TPA: DnaJ domain-containing protein [Polyangiaceae bacterium]|nr:DnaJ domain-containing protein [Polyangiaceae bacterium]
MNEAELSALTGFDLATVTSTLDRLARFGAVVFERANELVGGPPSGAGLRQPPPVQQQPLRVSQTFRTSQTNIKAFTGDPPDFAQVSDLDGDRKRKVVDLYSRLAQLDYYTLLGVTASADRKEIKRAYYAIAPDYHPDKFYGKNLGSFKPMMEGIFGQLTFAYETLSSLERRAEYDAYLSAQAQTRSMEELLRGAAGAAPVVEPISPGPMPVSSSVPPEPTAMKSDPAVAVANSSTPPASRESDRARREALARKLGVSRGSFPPEARRSAPPPDPTTTREAAQQALKRRHDLIAGEKRRAQARRYIDAGAASLKDNPAAAANAYRLALALDPENPDIIRAHRQATQQAAIALAGGYLKQGDYESRNGQWLGAARSYARAVAGMPEDAAVLEKAAHATLKAGGDMRAAVEFAKRAIALVPKRLESRLTLIEAYLGAGFAAGAKRELEAAREIAPRDDRITELSKRLK